MWYRGTADNRGKCLLGTVNDGPNTAIQIECDETTGRFFLLIRSDGGSHHLMRVFLGADSSATISDGAYHHLVWVVDDSSKGLARVYLDGNIDAEATVSGRSAGEFREFQYDLAIGASHVRGRMAQFAHATLDEVALYAHPLSDARVKQQYAAGASRVTGEYVREVLRDSPFGFWRLGDSSPDDLRLLFDSRNVERIENAALRVGGVAKDPRNPLFGEEHSWEVMFNNLYPNVIFDRQEKLYKVWYSMFIVDSAYAETRPEERTPGTYMQRTRVRKDGLAYAVSQDGIRWEKTMMNIQP